MYYSVDYFCWHNVIMLSLEFFILKRRKILQLELIYFELCSHLIPTLINPRYVPLLASASYCNQESCYPPKVYLHIPTYNFHEVLTAYSKLIYRGLLDN